MDNTQQIFPAFRLVAQFADGQRLTFDGLVRRRNRPALRKRALLQTHPAAPGDHHDRPDGL